MNTLDLSAVRLVNEHNDEMARIERAKEYIATVEQSRADRADLWFGLSGLLIIVAFVAFEVALHI